MKIKLWKILLFQTIIALTYCIILFEDKTIIFLGVEDGLIENFGAIFYLIASILFFIAFNYSKRADGDNWKISGKRNIFYLLLGILFIICFGEEISWGQRLLGVETPEFINKINAQKEINFHNIWLFHSLNPDGKRKSFFALMLNMSRLLSIFGMVYCVFFPVADKLSKRINSIFKKTNFPVPQIWIGFLFLTNYFIFKIVSCFLSDSPHEVLASINELKESNYAFIFGIFAFIEMYKNNRLNQNTD